MSDTALFLLSLAIAMLIAVILVAVCAGQVALPL